MKIYTKTGDDGTTGLFGGQRVSKASHRVEVYGEVDALNSAIGLVRSHDVSELIDGVLDRIQHQLFAIGAELATASGKEENLSVDMVTEVDVQALERDIDAHERLLPALHSFILPGGTVAASELHVARTTCRRVERHLVRFAHEEPVREILLHYFNRLSDLLFVLARRVNQLASVGDILWNAKNTKDSK